MNLPLKSTALAASAFALLGAAGAAQAAEYANVVSATPVTSSFPVARQQCADGQRVVPSQPSGGGALVGAIIGGVIGNQFGHGAGRVAATTIGAVTGGAIGNQAEINNSPGQVVPVQRLPHRQQLREPGGRLRRGLRVPRPALHDPHRHRSRPAPGDRRPPRRRRGLRRRRGARRHPGAARLRRAVVRAGAAGRLPGAAGRLLRARPGAGVRARPRRTTRHRPTTTARRGPTTRRRW